MPPGGARPATPAGAYCAPLRLRVSSRRLFAIRGMQPCAANLRSSHGPPSALSRRQDPAARPLEERARRDVPSVWRSVSACRGRTGSSPLASGGQPAGGGDRLDDAARRRPASSVRARPRWHASLTVAMRADGGGGVCGWLSAATASLDLSHHHVRSAVTTQPNRPGTGRHPKPPGRGRRFKHDDSCRGWSVCARGGAPSATPRNPRDHGPS